MFKGGTCLRHCYYSGYRFSEDLDYSCRKDSGGFDKARNLLSGVSEWVQANALLRLSVKEVRTIEGDFQVEIPIEYSRGGARRIQIFPRSRLPPTPRRRSSPRRYELSCSSRRNGHEGEKFDWEKLRGLFDGKCQARKMDPDPTLLVSDVLKSTNERVWNAQLSAVMATVPLFADAWQDWHEFCKTRLWTKQGGG